MNINTDLHTQDFNSIIHPYSVPGVKNLICLSAKDEYLTFAEHGKVIDAISSWWTILFGHSDPILIAALKKSAENLDHVIFAGVTHQPAIELAQLLLRFAPWEGSGKVFYSDNGSTAVEVALKISHQFWRESAQEIRDSFIAFEGGYHGDTIGTMSLAKDQIFFKGWEGLMFNCHILPLELEAVESSLKKNPGAISAIIIEPLIQGAGGMRVHSNDFLIGLQNLAKQYSIHLIVDEVMTGGGRTGDFFASSKIVPDLIATSKTLAGGMLPLAATLVSEEIFKPWIEKDLRFYHGHSFAGHPLACSVALANLLRFSGIKELPAKRIEQLWQDRILSIDQTKFKRVSILGSILAIELQGKAYGDPIGKKISDYAIKNGVFLRPLGDVVYAMPPLNTSNESLHKIFDVVLASINAMLK